MTNKKYIYILRNLRNKQIEIKSDIFIGHRTKLKTCNGGKIIFAHKNRINENVFLCADGGKLSLGNNVSINRNSICVCREYIDIGDNTSIGPNVAIYDHDHYFDSNGFKKDEFVSKGITIGKNCWIGANVCILKGSTIGDNCIVGAGTIVKGSIKSGTLILDKREQVYIDLKKQD